MRWTDVAFYGAMIAVVAAALVGSAADQARADDPHRSSCWETIPLGKRFYAVHNVCDPSQSYRVDSRELEVR